MTKAFASALALGMTLPLAGCDTLYGVDRAADLGAPLDMACARQAVETAPGVATVSYKAEHNGKGLFHPTPWVYSYVYRGAHGSGILGVLQIHREYDGKLVYHDTLLRLNARPPQAQIDATRPVMRAIEKKLAADCGMTDLPRMVREECNGVACNPLGED